MAAGGRLLRRDFVLLCQGQAVSTVGDAAYRVALGFWVLERTGSTALMGLVVAASLLPKVALAPWAGALADRLPRRSLLVAADLAAGTAALGVGLAAWSGRLSTPMLLVAAVVIGAAAAIFDPALLAAMPEVVPPARLGRGNAVLSVVYTGATMAGSALGGVAYGRFGAAALFVANGGSFLYSAASLLLLRSANERPVGSERSLTGAAWEAVRWVGSHRGVRALLAAGALAHLGVSAALLLLLARCDELANLGAAGYGAAMAGLSGGALVGFVVGSWRELPAKRRLDAFVAAGAAQAIALGAMGRLGSTPGIVLMAVAAGLAMAIESTVLTTALQLGVEPAARGRVFALRAALTTAVGLVANLAAGLLAERAAIAALLLGASFVVLAAVALAAASSAARQVLVTPAPEPPG